MCEFKTTETRTELRRHSTVNPQTRPALYLLNKFFPTQNNFFMQTLTASKLKLVLWTQSQRQTK